MPRQLKSELHAAIGQARGVIEDLERLGLADLYAPAPVAKQAPSCAGQESPAVDESLKAIAADLGDCRRCALSESRNAIVFGVGNANADLVFVGEGPGREEDRLGEPFVGEAGQLLDRILLAMGLKRSDVYICNVVKCRPPGNRDPQREEIAACEPFLARQLAALRPQVVVALGKFATQTLLGSDAAISRLRGHWQQYRGIPLMPTFHPAYLLRSPAGKRDVWEDMKAVMKRLRESEGEPC